MLFAGTPKSWPTGPSISTLHVLLVFVGIPLLVIATVNLLVYAPSWVKGPRYRPGQAWEGTNEWFGTVPAVASPSAATPSVAETPVVGTDAGGGGTVEGATARHGMTSDAGEERSQVPLAPPQSDARPTGTSGGASAGW